jgi:hypothetical protein
MEPGTASIKAGTGRITTRQPPSPVRFDSRLFPQIVNGEPVYFSRINGHLDQAADVVRAAEIAPLMARRGDAKADPYRLRPAPGARGRLRRDFGAHPDLGRRRKVPQAGRDGDGLSGAAETGRQNPDRCTGRT